MAGTIAHSQLANRAVFEPWPSSVCPPTDESGALHVTMTPSKLMATIALASTLSGLGLTATPAIALADEASDLQAKVESTIAAYNEASRHVSEVNENLNANQAKIDALESELPELRRKAAASIGNLYKMQQSSNGLLDLVLSAEDFNDLISTINYLDIIASKNNDAIDQLLESANQLSEARDTLKVEKIEAESAEEAARSAMNEAIAARQKAQEEAVAKLAAQQAEAAAAAAAAKPGDTFTTASGTTVAVAEPAPEANPAPVPDTTEVTWSERDRFINEWAGRIDAYLEGSPLEGYGATFAGAAFDHGVDPRFSPAIATVESSNGAVCFMPHNAWGWGTASWDDWDSAINDHVAGLAKGYGYTVSPEAARKYCPPNWEHWYTSVVNNMNSM